MASGYPGQLLYVDLSASKVTTTPLEERVARSYFGGSGLGAKLISDKVGDETEPFDPESPLIFAPGLIAGTLVPGANRTVVCGLSPATGLWGEARAGGTWGPELKYAGYDAIVITGAAESPVYLRIEDGEARIRPAAHLWGQDYYETERILLDEMDGEAKVAGIGQAGEQRSRIACVMFDGRFARAAGRTGLGAVMGSKNLKAVAVRGTGGIRVADVEGLRDRALRFMVEELPGFKRDFEYGTAGSVEPTEEVGDMPIRNFLGGRWSEGAAKISGRELFRRTGVNERGCHGCPVHCTLMVRTTRPPYQGLVGHGPEYETLASFGGLCDNDDVESIVMANELCNRYGMDTISAGVAVAFATEAYEKGLIGEKETGGLRLRWGDPEAILEMIHKIGRREDIGDLLADGVRSAAEKLGPEFKELVIEGKGLEVPMHDPRAYMSSALNYATGNRGACHVDCAAFAVESGVPMPDFGYTAAMDRFATGGKAMLTMQMHDLMGLYDALGVCKFYFIIGHGPKMLAEWVKLTAGWALSQNDIMKIGERIFNLKRWINVRRGAGLEDDYLAPRFLSVPQREDIPPVSAEKLETMRREYYRIRGWDASGAPTEEKLIELGLR